MWVSLRVALIGLSVLVLTGCAAGTVRTVGFGTYSPGAARMYAAWAGSRGPLLIEMRNSPYPDPPQRAAQILAESATGASVLPGVGFTANPAAAWHPDWRVVFSFNVPASLPIEPICNPALPLPAAPAADWYALVVFCNGAQPINAVGAWSGPVPGPDSVEFRAWARHVMYGLFPPSFDAGDSASGLDWPP